MDNLRTKYKGQLPKMSDRKKSLQTIPKIIFKAQISQPLPVKNKSGMKHEVVK
jgi:hypothetical protein